MFSKGQIAFIIFFVLIFAAGIIWAYRKDIKISRTHYRGAVWILVGIIMLFSLLFVIVKLRSKV